MTRVFLTMVTPLLLPTALYVLWSLSMSRGEAAASLRGLPWTWLGIAGIVLMLGVLLSAVELGGARDGRYVPPYEKNGEIVPGHVEPAH